MFDGVPSDDQFHQFIASSRTSLPIPLSFPLHGVASPSSSPAPPPLPPQPPPPSSTFPSFDHYPTHQTLQQVAAHHEHNHLHHHHHHQLQQHHQSATSTSTTKDEKNAEERSLLATNLMVERDHHHHHRSVPNHQLADDPWSNDEVLTLLRIRSSMDSWFPDFTWEHVSRKLAEVGFKRSAEKCKEKFEDESRHFNSLSYNKNYRFFTELDEFYQGDDDDDQNDQALTGKNPNLEKQNQEQEKEDLGNAADENDEVKKPTEQSKKRKRKHKFEMLKGFCEAIVNKIMSQQEALHNKFIDVLAKRDEEMMAKKEAWKIQEMDRLNKEIEIRAREQAISNDRQAKLIELLKKITSNSSHNHHQDHQNLAKEVEDFLKIAQKNPKNTPSSSSDDQTLSHHDQNPSFSIQPTNNVLLHETSSSTQNPSYSKIHENSSLKTPSSSYKVSNKREDIGKRWPRDEVLALINLKCNSLINFNNNGDGDKNEEVLKGPLWERISQKMQQLGYKRSAKRCKEKWENINKYFRKTKDNNKKRSLDSRTCPYFHQLNSLYNQGILVAPTDVLENRSSSPRTNRSISGNASVASQSLSNDEDQQLPSVQV